LLLDSRGTTFTELQGIIQDCGELGLQLEPFLRAVYHNQIRNAFSHSEIWFVGEYIDFQNFDHNKDNDVPSLRISTWNKLFSLTTQFTAALFAARHDLEVELKHLSPYRVNLPKLCRSFVLSKDHHGYWSAQPE
jgi:hypothetical protein